jgi:hypothetical protein
MILLGPPVQVWTAGDLGLREVPDMHSAPVRQPDRSYNVFISGVIGGHRGSTGLFSTRDFRTYTPIVGTSQRAEPVIGPSCLQRTYQASCVANWDSDYAGANAVFDISGAAPLLLMVYHGETRTFGSTTNQHAPFFAQMGVATSTDGGRTWSGRRPVASGDEAQWQTNPATQANGAPEGGAILANGYIYTVFPYFRQSNTTPGPEPILELARAPVTSAAKGNWTKYDNGWGREPALRGHGSAIVNTSGSGCTGPRQPTLAHSQTLNGYVLLFICNEGWFFSTSTAPDLSSWTTPVRFRSGAQFVTGQPNDDNYVLVTPGNAGQELSQTGLVLYAHTEKFGKGQNSPHELWYRTFQFVQPPQPQPPGRPPSSERP